MDRCEYVQMVGDGTIGQVKQPKSEIDVVLGLESCGHHGRQELHQS